MLSAIPSSSVHCHRCQRLAEGIAESLIHSNDSEMPVILLNKIDIAIMCVVVAAAAEDDDDEVNGGNGATSKATKRSQWNIYQVKKIIQTLTYINHNIKENENMCFIC